MSESKTYQERLAENMLVTCLRSEEFFKNYGNALKEEHFMAFNEHYPILFQIRKSNNGATVGPDIYKSEAKKVLEQRFSKTKKAQTRADLIDSNYKTCSDMIDDLFSLKLLDEAYLSSKVEEFIREMETASLMKETLDSKNFTGEYKLSDHIDDFRKIAEFHIETKDDIEEATVAINKCVANFPEDAIQGFLREFAKTYSKVLESPYPFWLFNAAVCLGNIFSTRVKMNTQLHPEPRFFAMFLGESATTRKSECSRQVIDFFRPWINPIFGCGSGEGLLEELQKSPSTIMVYDEIRSFVQKADAKGSNLLPAVNTLFEYDRYQNKTSKKNLWIENVHLSLIGCCTTETWSTLFSPAFIDIGFINRLWIVPGEGKRKNPLPVEISNTDFLNLKSKMERLFEIFPPSPITTIEFDPEALDLYSGWYLEDEQTEFSKRLDTYCLRLLIVMAISERKKIIDKDMVDRAIQLLDWQKKVRQNYQPMDYADEMAQIENLFRRAVINNPRISKGKLLNRIGAKRFSTWKVEKALKSLVENRELREIPSKGTTKYEPGEKIQS